MKIYTPRQLAEADKITIQKQHISSLQLMERAASLAYQKIKEKERIDNSAFAVFCGVGNNGGDGLVIARKLAEDNATVKVFIVRYGVKPSADFSANFMRLQKLKAVEIITLNEQAASPTISTDWIIIDAIFGIGLNRSMPQWVNKLVAHLNTQQTLVWAIDMPSGLPAHSILEGGEVLKATYTLTFQCPKLTFFLPQTAAFAGKITVLDIGLDADYLQQLKTNFIQLEIGQIASLPKKRPHFAHKGTFGHGLVVGGSYGKMGSVVLATQAALRAGAGKVTSLIPSCGYVILQTTAPEAMVLTSPETTHLSDFEAPTFIPTTVCFGIGAGTHPDTATFFKTLLQQTEAPMVIDADGLNILARHLDWLSLVPQNSLLTPHPKELSRLIGPWKNDLEKIRKASAFVKKYAIILILKGAFTMIFTSKQVYINSTGNPGMATAGSGDVLAGLLTGLMAQGYTPEEAALLGVYLHGKAGDIAVEDSSEEALVAGDLILNFGRAFQALKKETQ